MLFKKSFFFLFLISSFFLSSSFKKSFSRSLLYFHDENKVSKENDNIDIYPLKNNLYLVIFLLILFLFFVLYRYYSYRFIGSDDIDNIEKEIINPSPAYNDFVKKIALFEKKKEKDFSTFKDDPQFKKSFEKSLDEKEKGIIFRIIEEEYQSKDIENIYINGECSLFRVVKNEKTQEEINEQGELQSINAQDVFLNAVTSFIEYKLTKHKEEEYYGLLSKKDEGEEDEKEIINTNENKFVEKTFSINKFYKIFLEDFFKKLTCDHIKINADKKDKKNYKVTKEGVIKKVENSLFLILKVIACKLQLILSRNERKNNGKIVLFTFPKSYKEGKKVKGLKFEFGDGKKHQVNFDIGKNLDEVNQTLKKIKEEILKDLEKEGDTIPPEKPKNNI